RRHWRKSAAVLSQWHRLQSLDTTAVSQRVHQRRCVIIAAPYNRPRNNPQCREIGSTGAGVAASVCRGAWRIAAGTATQRRGYNRRCRHGLQLFEYARPSTSREEIRKALVPETDQPD